MIQKPIIALASGSLVLSLFLFVFFQDIGSIFSVQPKETVPATQQPAIRQNPQVSIQKAESEKTTLPPAVNLSVPFTSQAPFQNWALPYKEFCEEAAVLMAVSYVRGQGISSPEFADAKLHEIKAFEEKRFGFYEDTTAEETAIVLREYYGLKEVEVAYDPKAEDIKGALAQRKLVLVPAAGRMLPNPYFRRPGPLYHMLVIKGYTQDGKFITNDPGTRRGADFIYDQKVLLDAVHDWNGGNVEMGKKVMIVIG